MSKYEVNQDANAEQNWEEITGQIPTVLRGCKKVAKFRNMGRNDQSGMAQVWPATQKFTLRTYTSAQDTFLFYFTWITQIQGRFGTKIILLDSPAISRLGGKISTQHISSLQAIQNYEPGDTSNSGEPSAKHSQAEQQEKSTAAACTVSMELYKKQIFHSLFITYKQPAKEMGREVLPWTTN